MAISTYLSIIILNVKGLNALIKRHRVANWIFLKKDASIRCLQETHFRAKDTHRLKVRGKDISCKWKRQDKKEGVAILLSDKIDFKTKVKTKDKEGYYIMIKGSIQEEDTTPINIYAPNTQHLNI